MSEPTAFKTDAEKLAQVIYAFEYALPGWWWSVGQCSVGAHASCAIDGNGVDAKMLEGVEKGHPFDEGFHCDTIKGAPHEALMDVLRQASEFIEAMNR